jgi:hypothetical protein
MQVCTRNLDVFLRKMITRLLLIIKFEIIIQSHYINKNNLYRNQLINWVF